MGVFDKFLDIMRLNDDDDYDDDYYDDEEEYEDDYEEKPHRSFFGKKKQEDVEDNYDEEPEKFSSFGSNKVTQIHRSQPAKKNAEMAVCVVKPTSVEDARDLTVALLGGRTVILNLEGLDLEIAQRIIDFTSGATFAIDGNLQKISNYIFLATPTSVDISGDLQDIIGGTMAAASFTKSRF